MAEITRIIDPGQQRNKTTRPTEAAIGRSQLVGGQQQDVVAGDATANGDTIVSSAVVINGSLAAHANQTGALQTVTAFVTIVGAAAGTATKAGATQPVTATVIGATSTGAAAVSGSLVGAAASAVGAALVTGSATTSGATPTATTTLVAGTASGAVVVNGNATGGVVAATGAILGGAAAGASAANGVAFTATTVPIPGTATGGISVSGNALGAIVQAATTIFGGGAGTPQGSAFQDDAFQSDAFDTVLPAFQAQAFQSDAFQVSAAEVPTEIAVIFGGGRFIDRREDAVAHGELLTCFARIVAGRVSTVSLLAGGAVGDAIAANDNLNAIALLIPGTAAGERNFADDELLMIFAEAA